MNKAYLLTGGNIGDRKAHLQQALDYIGNTAGEVTAVSGLYETAAWGKTDQPAFLNQAIAIQTSLSPQELLSTVLSIETKMGRFRQEKFGPRVIDIDILLYSHEVINDVSLTLPHPELANRRFALEPLCEIAADFIHPVLHKNISRLLLECNDTLPVKKLEN